MRCRATSKHLVRSTPPPGADSCGARCVASQVKLLVRGARAAVYEEAAGVAEAHPDCPPWLTPLARQRLPLQEVLRAAVPPSMGMPCVAFWCVVLA